MSTTADGASIPPDIPARVFASMLPRQAPGGLVAHPAVWNLIAAAGGQPLDAVHRHRLTSFGATHESVNRLNSVILNSRPLPQQAAALPMRSSE